MRFTRQFRAIVLVCGVAVGGMHVAAAPPGEHDHDHPTEGPHRGTLIELGKEDYHAELVHDEAADAITIHVLDSSATKAVPITAKQLTLNMRIDDKPRQFALVPRPQDGEATGSASAFATTDKELCRALHTPHASGRLNVEIGGKIYVGKVRGHTHNHDHKHVHERDHAR